MLKVSGWKFFSVILSMEVKVWEVGTLEGLIVFTHRPTMFHEVSACTHSPALRNGMLGKENVISIWKVL